MKSNREPAPQRGPVAAAAATAGAAQGGAGGVKGHAGHPRTSGATSLPWRPPMRPDRKDENRHKAKSVTGLIAPVYRPMQSTREKRHLYG